MLVCTENKWNNDTSIYQIKVEYSYYIQIFTVLKNHSFNNASSYHILVLLFFLIVGTFSSFLFSAEMAVLFLRSSLITRLLISAHLEN